MAGFQHSQIYHEQNGRLVSRHFPNNNLPMRIRGREPEGLRPTGSGRYFYARERALEMIVGEPEDLALEKNPSYGRIENGADTGWAYRGLRRALLLPRLRTYIIDDHHYFYYVLWEARKLGWLTGRPPLYHLDMHHDLARLDRKPPKSHSLNTQSRYTVEHLRVGTHITAVTAAELTGPVSWITTAEELELKMSDMAPAPHDFSVVPWTQVAPSYAQPGAIVSLDWDFVSARFSGGELLHQLTDKQINTFIRWWRQAGFDQYSLLCIATSPGYAEESTMITGVKKLLRSLHRPSVLSSEF